VTKSEKKEFGRAMLRVNYDSIRKRAKRTTVSSFAPMINDLKEGAVPARKVHINLTIGVLWFSEKS